MTAILVIKLGALGDFIYALGPMQAIRRHHPDAHLTLLTRPAYAEIGRRSGLFDAIKIDHEPKLWHLAGVAALRRWLRDGRFARVYDLQTSDRTGFYHRLFWPGPWPEWSGIVPGGPLYHHYTRPTMTHTMDRQAEQLRIAGIEYVDPSDLSFMDGDVDRLDLPERFAVLVPGSGGKAEVKRWPAGNYAELARLLAERGGLTPLVIGGPDAGEAWELIRAACPSARSLIGGTELFDIPAIGRRARLCVGNDTGPMHLIAFTGCPTIALFSTASFPAKAAPRGEHVIVMEAERLADLAVDTVARAAGLKAE